jgi:hypothetical protein
VDYGLLKAKLGLVDPKSKDFKVSTMHWGLWQPETYSNQ